jgi:RNA polymerase sigma factor (sigma-70 family)
MTDQQQRENDIDLCEAVGRLPDRLRCVVLLHSYGYSQQEIADGLGVNQVTVSKRIKKGFECLRQSISTL